MVALSDVPSEGTAVIESVRAGGALGRELAALGLVAGTPVLVLRKARDHVLVSVHGARYTLGNEVAEDVIVREG